MTPTLDTAEGRCADLRAMLWRHDPQWAARLEAAVTVLGLPAPDAEPRTGHTCTAGPLCASWYDDTAPMCWHRSCTPIMRESCDACGTETVTSAIELARRVRAGMYHGGDPA